MYRNMEILYNLKQFKNNQLSEAEIKENEVRFQQYLLNTTLDVITDVLIQAGKFNGKVFGGYVRNVIVPRLYDKEKQVSFKDVDIYFSKLEDAENFVRHMGEEFKEQKFLSSEQLKYHYYRRQYHLIKHGVCIAWFDVIVAPKIPVNDFNVNTLTYHYQPDGTTIAESHCFDSVDVLISMIFNKRAIMLPGYVELFSKYRDHRFTHEVRRYFQRYQRLFGSWEVYLYYHGVRVPENVTLEWFSDYYHFKESPVGNLDQITKAKAEVEAKYIEFIKKLKAEIDVIADSLKLQTVTNNAETQRMKYTIDNLNAELETYRGKDIKALEETIKILQQEAQGVGLMENTMNSQREHIEKLVADNEDLKAKCHLLQKKIDQRRRYHYN